MRTIWAIIGFVVTTLIYFGWTNMLAFRTNLFLILLLLLSLIICISFWIFRKKIR
jgi:hypothetical protein